MANSDFGDYGHSLYNAAETLTEYATSRKEELSGFYDEKLGDKRDLTELSRLLANKIEEDSEVRFKDADKLRHHLQSVKVKTDLDLEDWDDFLAGKTDSIASWVLKIMTSQIDYHKKSISLDLERAALHLQDVQNKEKVAFDGMSRLLNDLDRTRRAFLAIGRPR